MTIERDAQTIQISNVRLSFPTLREAEASIEGGKKKFGANFLIDPQTESGKANIAACMKAIEAAEIAEFGEVGAIAKRVEDPKRQALRRGEKFKNQEGEVYEGYAGMIGISARADRRPKLFDRYRKEVPIENIDDVFVGGYACDAIIRFFCVKGQDKGGAGLFCTIHAIRSRQEGQAFGFVNNTTGDDFEELPDDNGFDAPSSSGTAPAAAGGNSLLA